MITDRITPAEVNKALAKAGLKVNIIRGNGYYWFRDETTAIPSIYVNSLRGFSNENIVEYVRNELAKIAAQRAARETEPGALLLAVRAWRF